MVDIDLSTALLRDATHEIARLREQISQLRADNWQLKQANADLLRDLLTACVEKSSRETQSEG